MLECAVGSTGEISTAVGEQCQVAHGGDIGNVHRAGTDDHGPQRFVVSAGDQRVGGRPGRLPNRTLVADKPLEFGSGHQAYRPDTSVGKCCGNAAAAGVDGQPEDGGRKRHDRSHGPVGTRPVADGLVIAAGDHPVLGQGDRPDGIGVARIGADRLAGDGQQLDLLVGSSGQDLVAVG